MSELVCCCPNRILQPPDKCDASNGNKIRPESSRPVPGQALGDTEKLRRHRVWSYVRVMYHLPSHNGTGTAHFSRAEAPVDNVRSAVFLAPECQTP
ncbi:hypothetical protein RRG08_010076 [Elysia crispata]|uniref:Uncharacterized protein n=1 Tax=Elysia crispata TaxID=231223 RepID=A0AAE1EBL0_9GAST|nr:hypothetical protein RRG08_010076 [Elysia crispata]